MYVSFFVSLLARLRENRFAWYFQGRCGVTMGWRDSILGQFGETVRCATRGRGLLCFSTTACYYICYNCQFCLMSQVFCSYRYCRSGRVQDSQHLEIFEAGVVQVRCCLLTLWLPVVCAAKLKMLLLLWLIFYGTMCGTIVILYCLFCHLQVIENLDTLVQLDSLYFGKNKITKIQNLSSLTQLTILSLQVWIVF